MATRHRRICSIWKKWGNQNMFHLFLNIGSFSSNVHDSPSFSISASKVQFKKRNIWIPQLFQIKHNKRRRHVGIDIEMQIFSFFFCEN